MVAFFTDEEGARFGTDMLGSAVATGRIALERAYALTDRDGRDGEGRAGEHRLPRRRAGGASTPPHAYVECHIEQGPMLRAASVDVGVVTGVQAICWHELTLDGQERPRRHHADGPARRPGRGGVAASS